MTVTSSAAFDIGGGGGGRRSDRLDSDRTSEDMSFIASPANVSILWASYNANQSQESFQIGASFVDVQNESSGSIDTATAVSLYEREFEKKKKRRVAILQFCGTVSPLFIDFFFQKVSILLVLLSSNRKFIEKINKKQ